MSLDTGVYNPERWLRPSLERLSQLSTELHLEMNHFRNDDRCADNEKWLLSLAEIVAQICDWAES